MPNADLPPAVRAVTDNAYDKLFKRYTPRTARLRPRSATKRPTNSSAASSQAGGILKEGSDPPRGMAALLMHQALVMDVEAGVPPMTAIQAATLNVAKTFARTRTTAASSPARSPTCRSSRAIRCRTSG